MVATAATRTPSRPPKGSTPRRASPANRHLSPGTRASPAKDAFVTAVTFDDLVTQYRRVCRVVGVRDASESDIKHMCQLLGQMALLDVQQGAERRLSFGAGGRGKLGAGQSMRVVLRAGVKGLHAALAGNPALASLLSNDKR